MRSTTQQQILVTITVAYNGTMCVRGVADKGQLPRSLILVGEIGRIPNRVKLLTMLFCRCETLSATGKRNRKPARTPGYRCIKITDKYSTVKYSTVYRSSKLILVVTDIVYYGPK